MRIRFIARALTGLAAAVIALGSGVELARAQSSCSGPNCCIRGSSSVGNTCVKADQGGIPAGARASYRWVSVRQKEGNQKLGVATADGRRTLVAPNCVRGFFTAPTTFVCEVNDATIHVLNTGKSVKTGYASMATLGSTGLAYGVRSAKSQPSLTDIGVFGADGILKSTITDVVRTGGAPMTRPRERGTDLFVPIGETWLIQRSENGVNVYGYIDVLTGAFTRIGAKVAYLASRTDPQFARERFVGSDNDRADQDPTRVQLAGAPTGRVVTPGPGLENVEVIHPFAMDGQPAALPPGVLGVIDVDGLEFGYGFAVVSEAGGQLRYAMGAGDALSVLANVESLAVYDGIARVEPQYATCATLPNDFLCNRYVAGHTTQGWVVLQTTNPEVAITAAPTATPQQAVVAMTASVVEARRLERVAEQAARDARQAQDATLNKAALYSFGPCFDAVVAAQEQGRWTSVPAPVRRWAIGAELRVARGWASAIEQQPATCASLPSGSAQDVWSKSLIAKAPLPDVVSTIEAESDFQFRLIGFEIVAKRPETAAQTAYGRFLWRDRDPRDAMKVWAAAADGGDLGAQSELAWKLYQPSSNRVLQDVETAYLIAKDGASKGSTSLQRLVAQIEADRQRQAQLDAYNAAAASARTRMDFILRCGYVPPEEQHKWICAR